MADPAPSKPVEADEPPPLDPFAVERAYRRERSRRHARRRRQTESRRSGLRFWVVLVTLLFIAAFLLLGAWYEVQSLFGV
jgi:hypothetical protein